MGLVLVVGVMHEDYTDEEGAEWLREDFDHLNTLLRAAGLPEHQEPRDLDGREPLEFEMYGYSGLHYLRRYASLLWAGETPTPVPQGADHTHGSRVDAYWQELSAAYGKAAEADRWPLVHQSSDGRPNFDHLLFHPDHSGFYLPVDFKPVVIAPDPDDDQDQIYACSSVALGRECVRLAESLGLSLDMDPESEKLWFAPENVGNLPPDAPRWQRFGIESFTCSRLYHACRASVETGAALAFQ